LLRFILTIPLENGANAFLFGDPGFKRRGSRLLLPAFEGAEQGPNGSEIADLRKGGGGFGVTIVQACDQGLNQAPIPAFGKAQKVSLGALDHLRPFRLT
jgi:hypothetical protein